MVPLAVRLHDVATAVRVAFLVWSLIWATQHLVATPDAGDLHPVSLLCTRTLALAQGKSFRAALRGRRLGVLEAMTNETVIINILTLTSFASRAHNIT